MSYLMGSTYFFKDYEDFSSKDIDVIEIVESSNAYKKYFHGKKKCVFQVLKQPTTQDYINNEKDEMGMSAGKFLVPEFNAEIGFTIEDLPKIKFLIDNLNPEHKYEEIIYNAYLKNGSFTLTQEQRDEAYKSYRLSRKLEV